MGWLVPLSFVWFNAAWVILSNVINFLFMDKIFEGKQPSYAYDQSRKWKKEEAILWSQLH